MRKALITFSFIFLHSFAVMAAEVDLRIATIGLAPAGFKENGELKGFTYEIVNQMAERANLTYSNVIKPYSRVLLELKNGKSDMSIVFLNEGLIGKATPELPVLNINIIIIAKKDLVIEGLQSLSGKRLAIIRGSNFVPSELISQATLFKATDYKQGVKMLNAGRVDAFLGVDAGIYYTINTLAMNKENFGRPYVLRKKSAMLYISNHFTDEKTVVRLKAIVKQMQSDGTIRRIIGKYRDNQVSGD